MLLLTAQVLQLKRQLPKRSCGHSQQESDPNKQLHARLEKIGKKELASNGASSIAAKASNP